MALTPFFQLQDHLIVRIIQDNVHSTTFIDHHLSNVKSSDVDEMIRCSGVGSGSPLDFYPRRRLKCSASVF